MDSQRPFLYLTLIFVGFLLWTTWQQDHAPKPEITASQQTQTASNAAGVPQNSSDAGVPTQTAQAAPNQADNQQQAVASNINNTVQVVRIRTDVLDLQVSSQGGDILVADLPTYPVSLEEPDNPVRILDRAKKNYVAQSGLQHLAITGLAAEELGKLAPNHLASYQVEQTDYQLADGNDELIVPFVWRGENGITVTKKYHLKRGSFRVEVEHEVQNNSGQTWSGTEYRQLKHGPDNTPGGMMMGVRAFVGGAYYFEEQYDKISFDDMKDKITDKTTGGWISMLEHYFISAWIPNQTEATQYYSNEVMALGVPGYILGARGPAKQIAAGATDSFNTSFWVGPKLQEELEQIAQGLDLTVDYGIFAFISKPIFWVMKKIHSVVQNWGWTIIFLTLLIKLIFFWPSAASYKSMAKMKAMAPRMKEIGERFSKDPQGKQKAMMELYKKEKLNPLGGCLPILIQIPVFMGLYWVLLESVELRQAPWLLWYEDLSIKDPFYILPLIMGGSMYLQQKLNPPQVDPMQQKIFQFLPVVFTFMFLWFPAGLVLYWVVNNLLSIAQQWYINKKIIGHA